MGLGGLSYPNESHLKKKKFNPNGRIVKIGRITYDPTILCDPTRSYDPMRSYHFCDLATILNFLVRWDRKIVRFYDPDRDFDNYDYAYLYGARNVKLV